MIKREGETGKNGSKRKKKGILIFEQIFTFVRILR